MNAATAAADAEQAALERAKIDAELAKQRAAIEKQQAAADKTAAAADKKAQAEYDRLLKKTQGTSRTTSSRSAQKSPLEQVLGSRSTQTILNGVIRGLFGNGRR